MCDDGFKGVDCSVRRCLLSTSFCLLKYYLLTRMLLQSTRLGYSSVTRMFCTGYFDIIGMQSFTGAAQLTL